MSWSLIRRKLIVATVSFMLIQSVFANPEGGVVTAGSATIQQTPGTTQINQASDKAIIEWHSFNIGANEKTQFVQPSQSSIALNRIDPNQGASQIFGQLTANGRLILVNQAGVFLGPSAKVDVAGIIITTSNISNENFLSGNYSFDQPSPFAGSVENEGHISAADYGLVALVGTSVRNDGTIQARMGNVVLASGNKFTLDLYGDQLINFTIDEGTSRAGVDHNGNAVRDGVSNKGTILADGGTVRVSAQSARSVVDHAINMEGVVEAKAVSQQGGTIIFSGGDEGVVRVASKVNASGKYAGQRGGKVHISGKKILVDAGSKIDTSGDGGGGDVLIGGDYHGKQIAAKIANADAVVMMPNASINADALTTGNGGKVILWADNFTKFYGDISARGGALSGNGGFVETSGLEGLNVYGATVNTQAPHGSTGTWLLDPKNITVATGGGAALTDVDNFLDTPSSDVTIDPATINAALALVTLQANNDITFTDAINIAASGIGLTAQAGRSILVNANITTNNAPITFVANETTANGVQDADRDAGAATITMGSSTTINSGTGNVSITLSTGAGLTNSTSGNIVLNNVTTNHGLVVNNGPTAGSSILRASASSLFTADTFAMDVNGAGGSGSIGLSGSPIRFSANVLEARSQSGGAFFTKPVSGSLQIGGASLGGLTGISTTSGGNVSVALTDSSITQSESVSISGTTSITTGSSGNILMNNSSNDFVGAVSSSNGQNNSIQFRDANDIVLGNITLGGDGNFVINAVGITQALGTIITGTNSFSANILNAGAGAITLTNNNVLPGRIQLSNSGANNISINSANGFTFATSSIGSGTLTITAASAISQTVGTTITQAASAGAVSLTATSGAITLTNANDFTGVVSLNNSGANNVAITDANSIVLGTSSVGTGTLGVTATGANSITQTGAITQAASAGAATFTTGAGVITLTQANDFTGAVSLNNSGANDVAVTDANSIILGTSSVGTGALAVTATGANSITQTGAITQAASAGAATFTTGAGAITLTQSNDFTGAVSVNNSGANAVSVTDANAITIGASTVGSSPFTINAGTDIAINGAVSQSGNLVLNATGNVTQNGSGIISGTGGLVQQGAGTATLSQTNLYTGLTSITAGTLAFGADNVISTGAITVNGGILDLGASHSDTVGTVTLTSGSITGTGTSTLTTTGTFEMQAGSVSAILAGAVPLNKTTGGTVTLSGANTYSGLTSITGGTLAYGADNAIGSGAVTVNGGTLDLGASHSDTVGTVTLTSGSITGTGTSALTTTGTFEMQAGSVSAILAGAVPLNKTTVGTVTLSGANTYSGLTSITDGTLAYGADNAIGSGAVTVNGGTLDLGVSHSDTVGTVTLTSGSITGTGTSALTTTGTFEMQAGSVSAILAGAVPLNKTTVGTVTLSGANTYTGLTSVNAGTLAYGADNVISSGAVTVNGGTLDLGSSHSDTVGTVTLSSGSITGTGSSALTTTGTFEMQAGSVSAILAGAVPLNKTTVGTVTLSGANTYTGLTSINAGTLAYGADNVISTGAVTVNGGTLDLGASHSDTVGTVTLSSGSITGTGTSSLTTTGTFEMEAGSVTAILAGAVPLNKTTGGTVTLSGANTYSGLTSVNAGTLAYGVDNAIGSGAVTVNGGTLDLGASHSDTVGTVTLSSGSITGTGTSALTTTGTFEMEAGSVSAILAGAVPLNKTTAGTVILSGANTYTGITTISAGTLRLGAAGVISDNSALNFADVASAVFDLNNFDETVASITGGGTTGGNISLGAGAGGTLTAGGDNSTTTYSGLISGTGGLTKNGTGTLTLGQDNTYSGTTTINDGILQLGSANAVPAGSTLNIAASGALGLGSFSKTLGGLTGSGNLNLGTATLTINNAASNTYTGILSGSGNLVKQGVGILTLAGNNNYTGTTTVSAGTLQAGVANAFSNSTDITVSGSGILDLNNFANTIGSLAGNGNVSLGSGTLTVGNNNASTTFSGIITGTGAVTKSGTGTFTLSNSNLYTGLTTVNAGTLNITNSGALGTTAAGVDIATGATLKITNVSVGNEAVNLSGGTLIGANTASLSGAVTLAADSIIGTNSSSDTFTLSGDINGANALTLQGDGNTVLAGSVGNSTPLTTLTSNAGTTTINGSVTTTGNQTYNNTLQLGGSATLTIGAAANLAINSIVGNNNALALIGNGGSLTINSGYSQLFTINSNDSGSLSGISGLGTTTFNNFANITGGNTNDTFSFTGSSRVTGTVNGGAGTNALSFASYASPVKIILSTESSGIVKDNAQSTIVNFLNIGSAVGGGNTTLQTPSTKSNTITITSSSGDGYVNDPYYFSGVNNFIGGGNTTIIFNVPATVTLNGTTFYINGVSYSFEGISSFEGLVTGGATLANSVVNVMQTPSQQSFSNTADSMTLYSDTESDSPEESDSTSLVIPASPSQAATNVNVTELLKQAGSEDVKIQEAQQFGNCGI